MAETAMEIEDLLEDKDVEYEQEIARNPYRLKNWLRYLAAKTGASRRTRNIIHERALKFLPSSYKLWKQYLDERRAAVEGLCITDQKNQIVVNTYERALVQLHKMPTIWSDYLQFLVHLKRGSPVRRTFDRALQSLPITQHDRIWPLYLSWAKSMGVKETAIRVYRRYLMYDPHHREQYVDYLESIGEWEEAASQLAECVNDETFVSPEGHTRHQLWMRMCDLCAKHPQEVTRGSLKVDAIIRSGLARFTDEVGRLWCKLADFYIRLGQFERARDVYEEAINTVITVRDFTMVFDAYSQFEESVLTAKMQAAQDEEEENESPTADGEDWEDELNDEGDDVDLRLARLEHLLERRPLLVSSVLLRQNPHNVHEWQKRIKLFKDDPQKVVMCYAEAVKTVDPRQASGKLCNLWVQFACFYELHGDIDNARVIMEKALLCGYRSVDDLATVWCAYADMELKNDNFANALEVLARATTEPNAAVERRRHAAGHTLAYAQKSAAEAPVQERVYKSTKVWNLYLELEESLGTVETARAAYDRAIDLKVATPQMVLNYTIFLEEKKYWEDSFRVYEKGINLFSFPFVKPIWQQYLEKFGARYGGKKLERARDLYEQVLEKVPAADAPEFYIKYAKLEEEHGLIRKAALIFDRACKAVPENQRLDMYRLYIGKVETFYGVTQTRPVYEAAIEALPPDDAREICAQFARLEQALGEIDRARAIHAHGSQFADPRRHQSYWTAWHDFEVAHGNEETFREMLRVKRSVQMAFSNVNYMAAEMIGGDLPVTSDADALAQAAAKANAGGKKRKAIDGASTETDMEALERQAEKIRQAKSTSAVNAVSAENPEEIDLDEMDVTAEKPAGTATKPTVAPKNSEELDIDDDEGDEGAGGDIRIGRKEVPEAVFGGAKKLLAAAHEAKAKGALERMKGKA